MLPISAQGGGGAQKSKVAVIWDNFETLDYVFFLGLRNTGIILLVLRGTSLVKIFVPRGDPISSFYVKLLTVVHI